MSSICCLKDQTQKKYNQENKVAKLKTDTCLFETETLTAGFNNKQMHLFPGESLLIGPPQPIVARVGDDIILPCHLEPAMDVVAKTLEWKRSDLNTFVHVRRLGQEFVKQKSPNEVLAG